MKEFLLLQALISVITFRACDAPNTFEEVDLAVDPMYTDAALELTPYITYEGEEEETFHFGQHIAWVEEIRYEDDVLYEHEEEDMDVSQQTTLEEEDEVEGSAVELDTEPGLYEVDVVAAFFVEGEDGEYEEYHHEITQSVEVRSEDED